MIDLSVLARLAGAVSFAGLLPLAGCANKYEAMTPEIQSTMMSELQAGKLNLDCGVKCDFTWIQSAPSIHALDLAEKWPDLAIRVMQIGYGSDLAYYYLGQAAQGLGYHQAAITYYATSLSLDNGPNPLLKCAAGQSEMADPCQGVDLAGSIPVLMQASRDAIASADQAQQQAAADQPAPVVHHHHHHTAPAAQPAAATSSGGSDWAVPPPAAAQ